MGLKQEFPFLKYPPLVHAQFIFHILEGEHRVWAVNHMADVTHFRFLARWTFPQGNPVNRRPHEFQYRSPSSLLNPSVQPTFPSNRPNILQSCVKIMSFLLQHYSLGRQVEEKVL